MKRISTLLGCLLVMMTAVARIYTPEDVPNVQKQDSTRFVSDPGHYLSDSALDKADARLKQLRDSTTAEVAVVIVPSLGDQDIFDFSQRLASEWGIGKADKDNGMLVVFDMDGHKVRLHPGQGLEGIFTDVACHRIIQDVIIPPMKTGDIDDAVVDMTNKFYTVLTDPAAAAEIRSPKGNEPPVKGVNIWYFLLIPLLATVGVYFSLFNTFWKLRGKSDFEKAQELHISNSPVMNVVLCILTLGLAIPAVLIRRGAASHYRNKKRNCDVCGTRMEKLPEDQDNKYLSHAQDLEERLHSVDYDVWLCPKCGATEIFPFPEKETRYSQCPYCGTHAMHLLYDRVERQPTATRKGVGIKVYECRHCGKRHTRRYDIPIATAGAAPIIIGGMGGFGSGHGGGGSMGGGFGGGSFGGGGSTGSW